MLEYIEASKNMSYWRNNRIWQLYPPKHDPEHVEKRIAGPQTGLLNWRSARREDPHEESATRDEETKSTDGGALQ